MLLVNKFTGVVAGSDFPNWLDFVYYRYTLIPLAKCYRPLRHTLPILRTNAL